MMMQVIEQNIPNHDPATLETLVLNNLCFEGVRAYNTQAISAIVSGSDGEREHYFELVFKCDLETDINDSALVYCIQGGEYADYVPNKMCSCSLTEFHKKCNIRIIKYPIRIISGAAGEFQYNFLSKKFTGDDDKDGELMYVALHEKWYLWLMAMIGMITRHEFSRSSLNKISLIDDWIHTIRTYSSQLEITHAYMPTKKAFNNYTDDQVLKKIILRLRDTITGTILYLPLPVVTDHIKLKNKYNNGICDSQTILDLYNSHCDDTHRELKDQNGFFIGDVIQIIYEFDATPHDKMALVNIPDDYHNQVVIEMYNNDITEIYQKFIDQYKLR